jgi:hypothetical protein
MTVDEFIRRFPLHALPLGLQRIRYYGLLGNRHRAQRLGGCRELLEMPVPAGPDREPPTPVDYRSRYEALTGRSLHQCPACLEGCMRLVEQIPPGQRIAASDTS